MSTRRSERSLKPLVAILAFVLLFAGAYFALSQWEKQDRLVEIEEVEDDAVEVAYVYLNGKKYTQKQGIATLLLLGIDNEGIMEESGSYTNDGQNDFNAVIVLNEDEDTYTILQINRDTMTEVQRLGIGGAVADSYDMQLALAHTYGSGMEDSCENTVTAVENFLYGITIDHYLAMNMTAVEIMVDAIGGITVTIQDDFSAVDSSLIQGETMTLNGSQCLTYIRARKNVGDQTNLSRSERQREFLYELISGMQDKKDSISSELLSVADYMLTDLSASRLSKLFEKLCNAECLGIVTPEGEAVLGDEYMEFYADDESVKEIVISLFYELVED